MAVERERVEDECVAEEVHDPAPVADPVCATEVHRVLEGPVDGLGVVALADEFGKVGAGREDGLTMVCGLPVPR
jgi:hypothetical protein